MSIEKYEKMQPNNETKITDENTYIKTCVDYALGVGWVKAEQQELLIREYLLPIYQKYVAIIEEVKSEIATDPDAEKLIATIIRRLSHILEITHRIGSTDHNNISNAIYDYRDRFCVSNTYLEYATSSLADFISGLLFSKS